MFETGGSWHSVVFHNLPATARTCYTLPLIQESLEEGGFGGIVKAFAFLCSDEEFARRSKEKVPVSMRVSVLSAADARQLVEEGGSIIGGRYRASHYAAKPRCPTPRQSPEAVHTLTAETS
ncbi:hypothetical protein B0H10DRAFT_1959767 [Mycena sp. CBHHK59/15]|nr:hypothetical protein B0H10DRAFT_1959767 [Mycena sp. CBHHK59/15]